MFELFCYATAVLAVLAFVGNPNPSPEAIADPSPQPEAPQPLTPAPAPAMAQTITEPVATLIVPTESSTATEAPSTDYQAMTSAQLRKVCQSAGVRWRNAHAKGKHLSKGEMVEAMIAALAK